MKTTTREMSTRKSPATSLPIWGCPDADERLARSKLGFHGYKLLSERQITQHEIAVLLGVKQPKVSHLMNGHFNRFSNDRITRLSQAS